MASHTRRALLRRGFLSRPRSQLQPLYKLAGTPPPTGLDLKGLENSSTDKAKVIATLKDSFVHAKAAIQAMPHLDKSLDWFGGKNTQRGILPFIVSPPPNISVRRSPRLVSRESFPPGRGMVKRNWRTRPASNNRCAA